MATWTRTNGWWVTMLTSVALALVITMLAAVTGWSSSPPMIRLVAGGSAASMEPTAAADEASAAIDARFWHPVTYRFELDDSARFGPGQAAAWRVEPPADLAGPAAALAAELGLGAPTPSPWGDGLVSGSQDGTGPHLSVGAGGDWYYNDHSGQPDWICVAVDPIAPEPRPEEPDTAPQVDRADDCAAPEPPGGVPSAAEARSRAMTLLADLGLPGTLVEIEVGADDWGAYFHGRIAVAGIPTDLYVHAAFGGEGLLTSASGTLARPVRAGDYPTVDTATALARLEAQHAGVGWGQPRILPMDDLATDTATGPPPGEVRTEMPVAPTGPMPDGIEPGLVPGSTEPTEIEIEPEVVNVRLVAVEQVLISGHDAEGGYWLVPGFRFVDDDSAGWWQVFAVADGYLELGVPPDHEILPVEDRDDPDSPQGGGDSGSPGSVEGRGPQGTPGEPVPVDEPGPSPELERLATSLAGVTEDDALARIEAAGATARIIHRDGEDLPGTMDLRFDRVNLAVVSGIVEDASIG